MPRIAVPILVLLLGLALPAAAGEGRDKPATPAKQFEALRTEFNQTAHGLYIATTDEERKQVAAQIAALSLRVLALAENYPNTPTAREALVQVVIQEVSLENNTTFPGRSKGMLETRAIPLLLRDHLQSDQLGEACWRVMGGFGQECETFLRTVLEKSPHREVRGLACFRLAQFLNARLHRLDLMKTRPEMVTRYRRLFGGDYLNSLQRRNRTKAIGEVEALFERAAKEYGEVKLPYEGTLAEKARVELHEIRYLTVGRVAQEIEGEDQDGKPFKLSDYRGKVVLLYFWSEY